VVGSGSITEVFRSASCWAPRERIRPKDARRECARDLTDAAMVFGLESTLSMVGRAVRGQCSQSRVRSGVDGGWAGGEGGCRAATSGRAVAYGDRVAARGRGEWERRAGAGNVVSAGGMLDAWQRSCGRRWREEGGMLGRVPWWAEEEDGMDVGIA